MNKNYIYQWLRALNVLFILTLISVTTYYLWKVTYPFVFAILFAFMMNPVVNFLEKKVKLPRGLSVFTTMVLIVGVIVGLVSLLIAEIIAGTTYLAAVVPEQFKRLVKYIEELFTAQIIPFYNRLNEMFNTLSLNQKETVIDNIQNVGSKVGTSVARFLQEILNGIPMLLAKMPNLATVFIFTLLATFFISKDWYKLKIRVKQLMPHRVSKSTGHVVDELKKALFGFVKAQLTLISLTFGIVLIGLFILRVDYAFTIALILGILDLLPYLGVGTVLIPWALYSFFSGDIGLGFGLSILYMVTVIQRQLAEPKILSSKIGIDPLATLVSLFIGFKLLGFLGLIAGPITLVIIRTLHSANVFRDLWSYIVGKEKPTA